MGAVLSLDAKPARSDSMHGISELDVSRIGLIKDRTACRNRLHGARNQVVLAHLRARLRQVEKQIDQVDVELRRLVAEDADLVRRYEVLMSIPGIGPIAAVAMIVEMPELGTISARRLLGLVDV